MIDIESPPIVMYYVTLHSLKIIIKIMQSEEMMNKDKL